MAKAELIAEFDELAKGQFGDDEDAYNAWLAEQGHDPDTIESTEDLTVDQLKTLIKVLAPPVEEEEEATGDPHMDEFVEIGVESISFEDGSQYTVNPDTGRIIERTRDAQKEDEEE